MTVSKKIYLVYIYIYIYIYIYVILSSGGLEKIRLKLPTNNSYWLHVDAG